MRKPGGVPTPTETLHDAICTFREQFSWERPSHVGSGHAIDVNPETP
jgi:hypothetical protein